MVSIAVDISNIVDGENIDAADVTQPISDLKLAVENTLNGDQSFDQISLGSASEVTISNGAITVSKSHHRVDTEANAASDDLETISGSFEGDILYLRLENAARHVVIKHNVGNIYVPDAQDFTLDDANVTLKLIFTGSNWNVIGISRILEPDFEQLVPRTVLSIAAAMISIQNIPAVYSRLQLVIEARGTNDGSVSLGLRFNNDTSAANYNSFRHTGNVSTTLNGATEIGTFSYLLLGQAMLTSDALSGHLAISIADVFDYASTSRPRHAFWRTAHHSSNGNSGLIDAIGAGTWNNSVDAINRIDIVPFTGNFDVGTAYSLYGIR